MNSCIRNQLRGWFPIGVLFMAAPLAAQTPPAQSPPPMDPLQAREAAMRAIDTRDYQSAQRIIDNAKAINPNMSWLNLANGRLWNAQGQYTDAMEALRRYNDTDEGKRDYQGWAELGRVYLNSKMFSSATGPLEKALDLVPESEKDSDAYANIALDLALTKIKLNNAKDAIEAIRKAQSASTKDGEIQVRVAELAFGVGDVDVARSAAELAIQLFKTELSSNPLSEGAQWGINRSLQVQMAIRKVALQKNPNDADGFAEAARIAQAIGDNLRKLQLRKAHEFILQSLEADGASAERQLYAAQLELELGATSEARTRIDSVLATDPDNADALALKSQLKSAGQ